MPEAPSVERFWEGFFGVPVEPGVRVVPHVGLAGYRGVWFFVRDTGRATEKGSQACVVSSPPGWVARLESALQEASVESLLSPDGLRATFGPAFDRSIGPTWLGWLPPADFRPVASTHVREASAAALAKLEAEASPAAWQDANLGEQDAFAWVEGGEVLAAASMRAWGDRVVGPGVLSRRPGCGRAVVSAACRKALARGDLVVYQTLRENERAIRLARSLGFAFHASHVAVRLQADAPGQA